MSGLFNNYDTGLTSIATLNGGQAKGSMLFGYHATDADLCEPECGPVEPECEPVNAREQCLRDRCRMVVIRNLQPQNLTFTDSWPNNQKQSLQGEQGNDRHKRILTGLALAEWADCKVVRGSEQFVIWEKVVVPAEHTNKISQCLGTRNECIVDEIQSPYKPEMHYNSRSIRNLPYLYLYHSQGSLGR